MGSRTTPTPTTKKFKGTKIKGVRCKKGQKKPPKGAIARFEAEVRRARAVRANPIFRGGDGGAAPVVTGKVWEAEEGGQWAMGNRPEGGSTHRYVNENARVVLTGDPHEKDGGLRDLFETDDPHDRAHNMRVGEGGSLGSGGLVGVGMLIPAADRGGHVKCGVPRKYHASQVVHGVRVEARPGGGCRASLERRGIVELGVERRAVVVGVDSMFDEGFARERRLAGLREEFDEREAIPTSGFLAMREVAIARYGVHVVAGNPHEGLKKHERW